MQNRRAKYILLPIVLTIWGFILYKIFTYSAESNDDIIIRKDNTESLVDGKKEDTVELYLHYADPFLKSMEEAPIGNQFDDVKVQDIDNLTESKSQLHKGTDYISSKASEKPVNPIRDKYRHLDREWPDIKYMGIVESLKRESVTGFIKIDGLDLVVREHDSLKNMVIEALFIDSIKIRFYDEYKTIFR